MSAFVFRCTILYLTISTPPVFVCFWLFHSFVRGERKDPSKVPVSARPNYRLPPSNLPGEEGAGRKAISLKHLLFARRGKKFYVPTIKRLVSWLASKLFIHKNCCVVLVRRLIFCPVIYSFYQPRGNCHCSNLSLILSDWAINIRFCHWKPSIPTKNVLENFAISPTLPKIVF